MAPSAKIPYCTRAAGLFSWSGGLTSYKSDYTTPNTCEASDMCQRWQLTSNKVVAATHLAVAIAVAVTVAIGNFVT